MPRALILALVLIVLLPSSAAAETVDIPAFKDNTLYEDPSGSFSNGVGQYFFAGRTGNLGGGALRRAVLAFAVADSIPAGSTIISATLQLSCSRSASLDHDLSIHRLTEDWGEGSSNEILNPGQGAPSTTGDATWVHGFFDTVNWGTQGGVYTAKASATTSVALPGFYVWGSTAEMVTNVQGWLDDPASNFGWILRGNEAVLQSAKRFDSRESPIALNRPALRVEYEPGVPVETRSMGRVKSDFDQP